MHAKKFPMPLFANEMEVQALAGSEQLPIPVHPIFIKITREKLLAAIEDVRQFCGYLEATRTR